MPRLGQLKALLENEGFKVTEEPHNFGGNHLIVNEKISVIDNKISMDMIEIYDQNKLFDDIRRFATVKHAFNAIKEYLSDED